MKILTKITEAKTIKTNDSFIFGEYQGEFIIWTKLDNEVAISRKILEYTKFETTKSKLFQNSNIKFNKTTIYDWCNNILGKKLDLPDGRIDILDKEMLEYYFPTENSRIAGITKYMVNKFNDMRILPEYWTKTMNDYGNIIMVGSNGLFVAGMKGKTIAGIRPVLKLD